MDYPSCPQDYGVQVHQIQEEPGQQAWRRKNKKPDKAEKYFEKEIFIIENDVGDEP